MANLFPYLALAATKAATGALAGQREGAALAEERRRRLAAEALQKAALERQARLDAIAEEDRQQQAALEPVKLAMAGIHRGPAPVAPDALPTGVLGAGTTFTPNADAGRYLQAGDYYVDQEGTPEYRAAQRTLTQRAMDAAQRMKEIEMQNAGRAPTLAETARHNREMEKIGARNATAAETRANRPPAGTAQGGGSLDTKQTSAVRQLRAAFQADPTIKAANDVAQGYQRVQAGFSDDSAQGDIALVYGYMKMLDPGSVVREGEYANAQNAAGIPAQIQNLYNRALAGRRLNPEQRTNMVAQARAQGTKMHELVQGVVARHGAYATRSGFAPEDVVYDPLAALGEQPNLAGAPSSGQAGLKPGGTGSGSRPPLTSFLRRP